MNPEEANSPRVYTAAQIAAALGITKRAVLASLATIPPTSAVIVSGNAANAWGFGVLPERIRTRLQAESSKRGYRNADQVLQDPPKAWQPRVPFTQVAAQYRQKALKLQRALAPSISRLDDLSISEAEFEALGVADFTRAFGYEISTRHWRRLFRRTVDRDRGAENFGRPDLYLDDCASAAGSVEQAACEYLPNVELRNVIGSFTDPANPTVDEVAYLWVRAFEQLETQLAAGAKERKTKRALIDFLFQNAPFLAKTVGALRRSFDRKLTAWIAGGRRPAAVTDKRGERSGWFRAPQLSENEKDTLVAEAVLKSGGRLSQAWRSVRQSGQLGDGVASHYLDNPADKSYVPRSIRDQVRFDIAALEDIHHGPRQAKINGAHISRDWSGVHAGDWYQGDDCTLPIYYYEPDGKGWFTLWRGQCLLMIDLRSTRILGYALLSSRNYNSLAIRTVITKICDEHGLPRRGFYFEHGTWDRSKILKGDRSQTAFSGPEVEKGLRDLGLEFKHANVPNAKPVERVLGEVQNLMEGDLGYVGRDERNDKFERVQKQLLQVASGKLDPRGLFYSREQWLNRLDEIFAQYNVTPQGGKMTAGLCPEEAFQKFRNPADPQVKLTPECRYLLAHHRRPVRVTGNGITLRFGKNVFVYRNSETGKLIGQTVLAWFNPELPDLLTVTDMDRNNSFTVERSPEIPAMDAPQEMLSAEMRRIAEHQAHAKAYYRTLKTKFAPQFRRNLVDAETADLGRQMHQQTQAAAAVQRAETAIVNRARKAAWRMGMPLPNAAARRPETAPALERLQELLNEPEGETNNE